MRIAVTLESHHDLNLPLAYNHILQGFIYGLLEPNLARWLHGEAYRYAQRTYKLFTFSRLTGRFDLDPKAKRIRFQGPATFQLASHNTEILASLAEHLLKREALRLGQQEVQVRGVEILRPPTLEGGEPVRVRTLSPITTYSTFVKPGGGKLTHYYSPQEADWSPMLLHNLARKARSLGWESANGAGVLEGSFARPLRVQPRDRKIIRYKGFVVQAWTGVYELKLPPGYLELAYDAGLGGKNSQGFGMVEVVSGDRN